MSSAVSPLGTVRHSSVHVLITVSCSDVGGGALLSCALLSTGEVFFVLFFFFIKKTII